MVATKVKGKWGLSPLQEVVFEKLGFEPTGEGQAKVLRSGKRFKLVTGGEQSGKSILTSKEWIVRWIEDQAEHHEMLLYWLVAMDYERTRAEFGYIVEDLLKLNFPIEYSKRVDPGYIELKIKGEREARFRIETKSAKDPKTLAMFAPNGIMICEASQVDLETYLKCLARVAPKKGWMILSGTLEGSLGWFPSLGKAWAHGGKDEQSFILTSTSNWHLYPGGEQDPEILRLKERSSDSFFMERIMGVAAPPKGRVFDEFREDVHIREVEYDPNLPLYIWEDPGYGHAHAIELVQIAQGGQVRVFDEIYERGKITEDLITMCLQEPWWKAEQKKLVIDPNYASQHHGTSSIEEIWRARTGLTAYGSKIRIGDGTERLKSFLKINPITGEPKIVFSPKCRGVLSELGAYPDPFDGQTRVYSWKIDREGNVIGGDPEDKFNDGLKALTYGLVEEFGFVTTGGRDRFVMMHHGGNEKRKTAELTYGVRHI